MIKSDNDFSARARSVEAMLALAKKKAERSNKASAVPAPQTEIAPVVQEKQPASQPSKKP